VETIKIGRITGAQGLRGEVKIYHDSGDDEALGRLTSLFLYQNGGYTRLGIEGFRMNKRTPVFKLEGVNDRTSAEKLIGADVYSDPEESRPAEEGSWLVSDLIGMDVRFPDYGNSVMKIVNIISNPAHDILEIETEKGVKMLPFVDVFVKEVDVKAGIVTVAPPAGWLE